MTTADRVDSLNYRSWAPTIAVSDDEYVGRHRKGGFATFAVRRMFYSPRHRSPVNSTR